MLDCFIIIILCAKEFRYSDISLSKLLMVANASHAQFLCDFQNMFC
jgi:hypothetical protein